MTPRCLIVNADDFGRSAGLNRGIIQAHEQGIVTSASLMVRWPDAAEAAAYAREHTEFSVGLHIDLAEWEFANGDWVTVYQIASIQDPEASEKEIRRQLQLFRELTGFNPTHIDSHQRVHLKPGVLPAAKQVAAELGVPLRAHSPARFCGDFYGQLRDGQPLPEAITVERFLGILDALPEGFTELGCHPGFSAGLESTYLAERETELAILGGAQARAAVEERGIRLCSFKDVLLGDN